MGEIFKTVSDFIESERNRFSNKHNNMFAISLSQPMRYRNFLRILIEQHERTSETYARYNKSHWDSLLPGSHPLTNEQLSILEKVNETGLVLQLEIESFYLFAKILLDRVAHFLEFYFGAARKISFDSHDQLTKNIVDYSALKNISLPSDLLDMLKMLKRDISDHRDYEIAHEKSPRTTRCTFLTLDGKASIISSQFYPTEPFKQSQTKPLKELIGEIDLYLEMVITLIRNNTNKTNLNLEADTTA